MSEALVSFLVEQLGSIIFQQVEQNVRLVVNVKKEVATLTLNLKNIQAVLVDAERRQVKEANVRRWLNNLKEVSYEIDDVVDEWNTEILKKKIEKQGENAVVPKKKVCFYIPFHCLCNGQVTQIIFRHDIAVRIKELNEKLALIHEQRKFYKFLENEIEYEQPERLKSFSIVDESETFGRDSERNELVSQLVSENSEERKNSDDWGREEGTGQHDREILNRLQPHGDLESLIIRDCQLATSLCPNWILSLHNLNSLVLDSFQNCEQLLGPFGRLPSLETPVFWGMGKVKKVGVDFLGIDERELQSSSSSSSLILFPKLKSLTFWEMPVWEEWEGVGGDFQNNITIMPSGCFKLGTLPDFLRKTPLQSVTSWDSPILGDIVRDKTSEEWAKISHVPDIQVDEAVAISAGQLFRRLLFQDIQ